MAVPAKWSLPHVPPQRPLAAKATQSFAVGGAATTVVVELEAMVVVVVAGDDINC